MKNIREHSLSDDKLQEIISKVNIKLEDRLNRITSSLGLADFIIDMSNMWTIEKFPIKEDTRFEDQARYYIFRNMMKLCKLEMARRLLLIDTVSNDNYLASVIRLNKLLTEKEIKIAL